MSYLVRKIERSQWNRSAVRGERIMAEVVASCIRPNGSGLSVWFAESEDEIGRAKLAMLAAMNKLATVDLVVLPVNEVFDAGLKIATTIPKSGPEILKPLHRDINDLDLDSLKMVAQIIQKYISEDKYERITMGGCKGMLQSAIGAKIINLSDLHEDLAKKL